MIGRERDPYIGQSQLMTQELEESRQLPVKGQSHGLHLGSIGTNFVTQNVVG